MPTSPAYATDYLARIEANLKPGNATEHTHRPAQKALLEAAGLEALARPITATNEPKQKGGNAPDFVLLDGDIPIGYVEAKAVGVDLGAVLKTDQLDRYRTALQNLILTDGLVFRWFVNGDEHGEPVVVADVTGTAVVARPGGPEALADLLQAFFQLDAPIAATAQELATRMAARAKLLRNAVARAFEGETDRGALHDQFEGFRDVLRPGLTPAGFADMYAQTFAYGLFAARAADPSSDTFTRRTAADALPPTNPFLRDFFYDANRPGLDPSVAWLVDELAAMLRRTDMAAVLKDFGQRTRQEDPIVHFYETFLRSYDPGLKVDRGVFYTPEPVVGYIVRSVDQILKRDFAGLSDGLASAARTDPHNPASPHRVQILDPATGTGTFLARVLEQVHASGTVKTGDWPDYVRDDLLPRLFGFELLMAPYTIAHMKLGVRLAETGYDFRGQDRLGVYLTNTLEDAGTANASFGQWVKEEAEAAGYVKRDAPVMVVVGNPPYKGASLNPSDREIQVAKGSPYIADWKWQAGRATPQMRLAARAGTRKQPTAAGALIKEYFFADGRPLGEANPKWLHNDYVKFFRFAEERIQRTGSGVLAFITASSFLNNPTFRGMRESLLRTFDTLHVLDLHGDKKERAPDGESNDNVFDIGEGVSISLFIKTGTKTAGKFGRVLHAERWGTRHEKYDWLDSHDTTTTDWTPLDPAAPLFPFRSMDESRRDEWAAGWRIQDVTRDESAGMTTARDALTTRLNKDDAWATVQRFAAMPTEAARKDYKLGKDARDWKVEWAQSDLKKSGPDAALLAPVLYRPFDRRWTYFTGHSRGFICMPRSETMQHMLAGPNLALLWTRPMRPTYEFSVLVTDALADQCVVGNKSAGAGSSYLSPLYTYVPLGEGDLFAGGDMERRSNLEPAFVTALAQATGLSPIPGPVEIVVSVGADTATLTDVKGFTPEDVFHYIYGLFHATAYRERYADFLRSEFPRVLLPPSAETFRALAFVGRKLAGRHLLRTVSGASVDYPTPGSHTVEKGFPRFVPPDEPGPDGTATDTGRVFINPIQSFVGVPEAAWTFVVGGYQVLKKWLDDRRKAGHALTRDDRTHYSKTAEALAATPALMDAADAAASAAFGWDDEPATP